MDLIASDIDREAALILDGFENPAILLDPDYRILAANNHYLDAFGYIDTPDPRCYQISHGYQVPCDQAGESCPLAACSRSRQKERVLHIHITPRGKEHVEVEMLPISEESGRLKYFVEILKPVTTASAELATDRMVGRSNAFNTMLERINRVAPTDSSVLLAGETGTGKELAAKAIHDASRRSDRPLVTVECAGLTETLFESELFGHIKGAFTGAVHNKPGLLERADSGTLFLDEIGDVPLGMQVKLLRLLETGTYRAVGDTHLKQADFRLVCATHKDLARLIQQGLFREDLYYRINVFPITLPPLRERGSDMLLIARSILGKIAPGETYHLTESAASRLRQHHFAGNIRELRNVLERATILAPTNVIDAGVLEHCFDDVPHKQGDDAPTWTDLKTQERRYLQALLSHCEGDKEKAAAIAGISERSLYRKLQSET